MGLHMTLEEFLPYVKKSLDATFRRARGIETEKSNQYSKVLHDLCADVDILKDGRFNKQLELQCLCVHPNYGNKGLGMKLVRLSEEKGKDLGCDVATIQAVNAVTDHIAKKTGYTTVRRVDVRDIRDETGRPLLDLEAVREGTGTSYFTYYMKKL
ncbi:uncharacterized protein LOC135219275 [Macrobrachium nipponense]|uniref:uncharacterized protein LOC135219275 n=1 Tax=Macrobrachium nipponense TaxID=159736 RepID=UPI0030C89EBD